MSNKDLVKALAEENEQLIEENASVARVKQERDSTEKTLKKYETASAIMGFILFVFAIAIMGAVIQGEPLVLWGEEDLYNYSDIEEKEIEISGLRDEKTTLENELSDLQEENTRLTNDNMDWESEYNALEEDFDILLGCFENNYDYCEW